LITCTILGEQYRSLSSSLCSFLYSLVTSSFLGPNILLDTLSQITSAYVPPSIWATKFHTHKKQQATTCLSIIYKAVITRTTCLDTQSSAFYLHCVFLHALWAITLMFFPSNRTHTFDFVLSGKSVTVPLLIRVNPDDITLLSWISFLILYSYPCVRPVGCLQP
jgi:hypothetical protein